MSESSAFGRRFLGGRRSSDGGQFGSEGKTWIRVKDQKERKTEQRLSRQTTTISIPPTCRMSEPTTNTTGDYKDNNSHVWFKLHFYSWSTSSPSTAEVPRSLSTREARIQVRKYICEPVHTTHLRAKAVWLQALKIVIVMGGVGGFRLGKYWLLGQVEDIPAFGFSNVAEDWMDTWR